MRKLIFATCLAISIVACKPKDKAPNCGVNEVLKASTCECDENSIWYNNHCEKVGGYPNSWIAQGGLIAKCIKSSCKTLSDSNTIFYNLDNFATSFDTDGKLILKSTVFYLNFLNIKRYSYTHINTFKKGVVYDTLISKAASYNDNGKDIFFNWYMAVNKARDSMFVKMCSTTEEKSYIDLDSCFLTFVRIR